MVFYDFEVFKEDWLVHFVDIRNNKETTIVNDRVKLKDFYTENKKRIFVGFNNNHYDQFIFKGILLGMNPWRINHWIINNKQSGWNYSDEFWKVNMINYDVMSGYYGLKQLEAFMGHNIKESEVDFTIDRKLTEDEIEEVIEYCKYDVYQTIEVFMRRRDEFNTKLDLIKEFDLPLYHIGKTNAQLSATVLGAVLQPRSDEFELNFPKELRINKYQEVVRFYKNPLNHDYKKKLEIDVAGVPHVFGWGGIHGAINNYIGRGKYVLVDVSSFYPSLMIEYDYLSRNVADKKVFEDMYKERQRLKALGDSKQEVFKLVLNTTYGCMGAKFNPLYDPLMRNNVCVTGQLLLLDLIERFEENRITVIQSNTDGILLKYDSESELDTIKKLSDEWSKRTRMNLDYEYYHTIIQKDVNNYMAYGDKYDVYVGAYVKDLHDLDNDLPVVNESIRAYFKHGIRPEDYIENVDELIKYQKIVRVTNKYEGASHNGKRLRESTIRAFASRSIDDGQLTKYREMDGELRFSKFANTSDKIFIDNGNIKERRIPRKLDKQWYIDLAWDRIRQFQGGNN